MFQLRFAVKPETGGRTIPTAGPSRPATEREPEPVPSCLKPRKVYELSVPPEATLLSPSSQESGSATWILWRRLASSVAPSMSVEPEPAGADLVNRAARVGQRDRLGAASTP